MKPKIATSHNKQTGPIQQLHIDTMPRPAVRTDLGDWAGKFRYASDSGNFLRLVCSQFLNSPLFKVLLIFVLLVHIQRMEQVGSGVFIK
jgi:hypothetical protein